RIEPPAARTRVLPPLTVNLFTSSPRGVAALLTLCVTVAPLAIATSSAAVGVCPRLQLVAGAAVQSALPPSHEFVTGTVRSSSRSSHGRYRLRPGTRVGGCFDR